MELQKMFIDGEWVEGSTGKSVPPLNPSNGEVLAMETEGNVEDVDKAIAAAKKSSSSPEHTRTVSRSPGSKSRSPTRTSAG